MAYYFAISGSYPIKESSEKQLGLCPVVPQAQ
jgi:hypothetical protein